MEKERQLNLPLLNWPGFNEPESYSHKEASSLGGLKSKGNLEVRSWQQPLRKNLRGKLHETPAPETQGLLHCWDEWTASGPGCYEKHLNAYVAWHLWKMLLKPFLCTDL